METPSHIKTRFGDACASGDGITFQAGVNNGTINIDQRARNDILPKAVSNATFDAANKEQVPSCLPGTRVELLKEIRLWIDGDNPNKVYWLSGMAGTGKSTIALTLARTYTGTIGAESRQRNVCLGATFFFSRGGGDLSSANKFPATIATQLAEASVELRTLIESVIDDNPRLDSLGVRTQWEKLILEPLSRLSQSSINRKPLLLIVDALDECDNSADTHSIIRCLEQATQIKGIECRVFVTSRPEQSIRLGMDDSASAPRENFVLHNIERSIVNQDLKLYYRDQLSRINATISSGDDMISEKTIAKLVERSNGLFIYAATVCRFVREGKWLAVDRLTHLMKTPKSESAGLELDKMYTTVLEYSFVSVTGGLTPDEVKKVRQLLQRVIGAIIVMFDVMSPENLAMLLGVKRENILTTLSALHSVIDVPECHSEPIRILHPSFREFLLDPKRCTDNFYSMAVSDLHSHLLTRCFASLMSQLRRNMLEISKPGTKARDIQIDRIGTRIPKELQYSSIYWWDHFQKSDDHSRKELPLLEFLEGKYLYWLECLSWLGKLGHAIEAMFNMDAILAGKALQSKFPTWMPSNNPKSKTASQLERLVPDALQFLLSNKLMIEEAPLQLYISALIFSPRSSEVRKRNHKEVPPWILNDPNAPHTWSGLSHGLAITLPSVVHSIAVSPDSTLVAAACGDGTIHVLDVVNGTESFRLEGNPDGVASVCFSPNGRLIGSLVQNCVSVWNMQAALDAMYQPEYQFCFRRQGVESKPSILFSWPGHNIVHPLCAISPSGNLVTVVDYPHDIWTWDIRARESFKYHFQVESQRCITGVYFSSDGSLLISNTDLLASNEPQYHKFYESVYAWHVSTGVKVSTKRSVPNGPLLSIVSGTSYITASPFGTCSRSHLIIRDARTGLDDMRISISSSDHYPDKALCRPADGKFLLATVIGSGIFLWMPSHRNLAKLRVFDSDIKSIEFSPNGKYLIAADSSDEVRIWNIENLGSKPSQSLKMHQGLQDKGAKWGRLLRSALNIDQTRNYSDEYHHWIQSHDRSLLATAPLQGSIITVWDMKTGEIKFRWNVPKDLRCALFSPSGNVFAVLAKSSVHFWETDTGQKGDILKTDGHRTPDESRLKISEKGEKVIYIEHDISDGKVSTKIFSWELDGLRKISNIELIGQTPPILHPVSPNLPTKLFIALSPNEKLYCLWSQGTGVLEIGRFPSHIFQHTALRDNPQEVKFMPDSKNIFILGKAVEGRRRAIHFWNIEQECLQEIHIDLPLGVMSDMFDRNNPYSPVDQLSDAVISPDGKLLALSCYVPNSYWNAVGILKISDLKALFLSRLELDFRQIIGFSPSGTHLITERGNFLVPGTSPPFPLLFAPQNWIQEDGEDILAIPPIYRGSIRGIYGHTITIRDFVIGPLFVRLNEGVKTMTA